MATAAAPDAAPAGGGKKKLIIIVAAVLVLAVVGVGVLLMMKKKPVDDEEGADAPAPVAVHAKPGHKPVFVPVDPFTVNLADKDVDRFAQVGITLSVSDDKGAEEVKAYMPAIRSNVLMVLSHKTSAELLSPEGKEKLAREIRREASRPMGIELDDEDEPADGTSKKKKRRRVQMESPITEVLFSTFIVQ